MFRQLKFVGIVLILCAVIGNCGGDSSNTSNINYTIPLEDSYNVYLTDQQEKEIYDNLTRYNLLYHRANILVNSTLFADMEYTSPDVVKARALKAEQVMSELSDLSFTIGMYEANIIQPIVDSLKASGAKLKAKEKGDLFHAYKLVDLYMNDDAFYKKYKLSDIARRTQVSMTRLRMMMNQVAAETETMGYNKISDEYAKGVRNMKAIRDTAVAAEGALVTFATGGAAAGTLGTFAKGVVAVEKANAIISCTEAGVGLINASMGTDEVPPTIQKVFTGNKVLSYVLLPKALASGDVGSIIALGGPTDDLTDYYYSVDTNNDIKVTGEPQNSTTKQITPQTLEKTAGDMLLRGVYNIPQSDLNYPNLKNTGFEFDDDIDLSSMDALQLEAAKLVDLWDLPGSPSDNYDWDTEAQNPDSKFVTVSNSGFPNGHPLEEDETLYDSAMFTSPILEITVSPFSGDAPLKVTFNVSVSEFITGSITYKYHHGDGGYEESNSNQTYHTYTEAGTYHAMVYIENAEAGTIASNTVTVTVTEPVVITPDGDTDTDGDMDDPVTGCAGVCSPTLSQWYCQDLSGLCACGDDGMWQYYDCDTACLQAGFGLPSECGYDDYGAQTCLCGDAVDGDVDGDTDPDAETWIDPSSGYMWQVKRADNEYTQTEAIAYCNNLSLGGFNDWRLPDLDSYRTFIKGCPISETGGACGYSNTCHDYNTCVLKANDCNGCGCGEDTCYWDKSVIKDSCFRDGIYWTSTKWEVTYHDDTKGYWGFSIGFCFASISTGYSDSDTYHVRCMRGGTN